MANVTLRTGNFIQVTLDGTTDWTLTGDVPSLASIAGAEGVLVRSITVMINADNDVVIIRNSKTAVQTAAAIVFCKGAADNDMFQWYFGDGRLMWLAMDADDTVGTPTVLIELGY
jgi:hypothetical protein